MVKDVPQIYPFTSNTLITLLLSLSETVLEILFSVFMRSDQKYSELCCGLSSSRKQAGKNIVLGLHTFYHIGCETSDSSPRSK